MNEENPSYYGILPATVRYDKRVPAGAKILYTEITSLCNAKGFCWASNQYFASLYDVSKDTITRWVSILKNIGYVVVDMQYKLGTREIERRCISICDNPSKNTATPPAKIQIPPCKNTDSLSAKMPEGICKNAEDNNKTNIKINIKDDIYNISKNQEEINVERVENYVLPDNVNLSGEQLKQLQAKTPNWETLINMLSIVCRSHPDDHPDHFAELVKFAEGKG